MTLDQLIEDLQMLRTEYPSPAKYLVVIVPHGQGSQELEQVYSTLSNSIILEGRR